MLAEHCNVVLEDIVHPVAGRVGRGSPRAGMAVRDLISGVDNERASYSRPAARSALRAGLRHLMRNTAVRLA